MPETSGAPASLRGLERAELFRLASAWGLDTLPDCLASQAGSAELIDVAWAGSALGELAVTTVRETRPAGVAGGISAEVEQSVLEEAAAFNLAVALFDHVLDEMPFHADALAASLEPSSLRRRLFLPEDPSATLSETRPPLEIVVRLFDFTLASVGRRLCNDSERLDELAHMLRLMYESELELTTDRLAAKTLPVVFIGALAIPPDLGTGRRLFVHLARLLQLVDDWDDLGADIARLAPNAFLDPDPRRRSFRRLLYLGNCAQRILGGPRALQRAIGARLVGALVQVISAADRAAGETRAKALALCRDVLGLDPCPPFGGRVPPAGGRRSRFGVAAGRRRDLASELLFRARFPARRPSGPRPRPGAEDWERAITRGLGFLERHQDTTGRLRAFLLHPGASTLWITAHAAWVLELVPAAEALCRRCAGYLEGQGRRTGGWGYNEKVAFDNDSSVQAAMVLHRFGIRVTDGWLRELCASQSPAGGFPTYRWSFGAGASGWKAAHPEVTCVVVEMLRRLGACATAVERGASWLEEQIVEGALPSYWWRSAAYGLWAQTRSGLGSGRSAELAVRLLPEAESAPDLPLLLVAATAGGRGDRVVAEALSRLISLQCRDGSWACEPCLRVTDPRCSAAGAEVPGRCHADRRRIFSTVHAVAALHAAGRLLQPDSPASR